MKTSRFSDSQTMALAETLEAKILVLDRRSTERVSAVKQTNRGHRRHWSPANFPLLKSDGFSFQLSRKMLAHLFSNRMSGFVETTTPNGQLIF